MTSEIKGRVKKEFKGKWEESIIYGIHKDIQEVKPKTQSVMAYVTKAAAKTIKNYDNSKEKKEKTPLSKTLLSTVKGKRRTTL